MRPAAEARQPRRRGWIIRRALLVADLIGLTYAFFFSQLALGRGSNTAHTLGSWDEAALFAVFVPLWILAAKLAGLYDRDEERADYSTTDDLVGVFVITTLFAWLYERGAITTGLAHPNGERLTISGRRVPLDHAGPCCLPRTHSPATVAYRSRRSSSAQAKSAS